MVQKVNVLAAKPEELSSVPRSYTVRETRSQKVSSTCACGTHGPARKNKGKSVILGRTYS